MRPQRHRCGNSWLHFDVANLIEASMRPQRHRCGNAGDAAFAQSQGTSFNEAAASPLRKLRNHGRRQISKPSFNEAAASPLRKFRFQSGSLAATGKASMRPQRHRCGNSTPPKLFNYQGASARPASAFRLPALFAARSIQSSPQLNLLQSVATPERPPGPAHHPAARDSQRVRNGGYAPSSPSRYRPNSRT